MDWPLDHSRAAVIDRLAQHLLHTYYPMLDWTLLSEGTRNVWRSRAVETLDVIGWTSPAVAPPPVASVSP